MKNTYYKVCKICNSTLDPGERCDCQDHQKLTARYICDRKKCKVCHPTCIHTEDITHAVNFENFMGMGVWFEKETQ